MNLVSHFREDLVLVNLKSTTKPDLFDEMVHFLVEKKYLGNGREVIDLLIEREKLMSTGIKRGFAIPHAFTPQLDESIMTVGISRKGIDFQALDDELVYFVFLLLGPPDQKQHHMRLLARLSRIMSQDELFGELEVATTPQGVLRIIAQEDEKIAAPISSGYRQ